VVNDHTDMMVKALSWSLRELSKTDEDAVIDFINRHENQLHKRVIREVNSKLTTGLKNARR
jgi:3-methyladenine DNA glycosylase AlkD